MKILKESLLHYWLVYNKDSCRQFQQYILSPLSTSDVFISTDCSNSISDVAVVEYYLKSWGITRLTNTLFCFILLCHVPFIYSTIAVLVFYTGTRVQLFNKVKRKCSNGNWNLYSLDEAGRLFSLLLGRNLECGQHFYGLVLQSSRMLKVRMQEEL